MFSRYLVAVVPCDYNRGLSSSRSITPPGPVSPMSNQSEADSGLSRRNEADSGGVEASAMRSRTGSGDSPTDVDRHPFKRATLALEFLRVGLGLIWGLNLLFVVDPANRFFSGFSATAISFSASSIGGTVLPQFASSHGAIFAPLIAGLTGYLAVALGLGITTRLACLVGFAFNAMLLVTQLGSVWVIPGGTDVGPQPLYLLLYIGLFLGMAGRSFSIDAKLQSSHRWKRTFWAPAHSG
jgi:hypothetical protein